MTDIRTLFCDAALATAPLVADPALQECFNGPSALPEFSVRGLAGHLLRSITTTEGYVAGPEPEGPEATVDDAISAAEYYAAVLEPAPDINSEFQRSIRHRAEEAAPQSADELPAIWAEAATRLRARLAEEPPGRLVKVYGDLVLTLDEYLVTRLIELIVHADDLAVSLGVELPPLPADAMGLVISTLVRVAQIRHGDLSVLRALSRRERDTVEALRVI